MMQNAAIRLLGLREQDIQAQARDIIFGQLRQVIASMQIEEINRDRDSFLDRIQSSLEPELKKIGLVLINVNITDITDESGYIEAIGRKAASTAIQQAEIDVAEQEKKGAVGVAQGQSDQGRRGRQRAQGARHRHQGSGPGTPRSGRGPRQGDEDRRADRGVPAGLPGRRRRAREAHCASPRPTPKAVQGENESKALIAKAEATLQVERSRGLPAR